MKFRRDAGNQFSTNQLNFRFANYRTRGRERERAPRDVHAICARARTIAARNTLIPLARARTHMHIRAHATIIVWRKFQWIKCSPFSPQRAWRTLGWLWREGWKSRTFIKTTNAAITRQSVAFFPAELLNGRLLRHGRGALKWDKERESVGGRGRGRKGAADRYCVEIWCERVWRARACGNRMPSGCVLTSHRQKCEKGSSGQEK